MLANPPDEGQETESNVEGFVLIGGASRRMGSDKARLTLGRETFLERIANTLSRVVPRISLVGARSTTPSPPLPYPLIHDIYEGAGALGGIHAALASSLEPWALVVACDLPFVSEPLLRALLALREGYEAVVPVAADGRLQPLCALYARAPCLPQAQELLAKGERRPRVLLERVRTLRVEERGSGSLAPSTSLLNVNTPSDYAAARRIYEELKTG